MRNIKDRIKWRATATAGRIRYELLKPRVTEGDLRKRLIPALESGLPRGKAFWSALYEAYVESCPSGIRSYDETLLAARQDNVRAALEGKMTVLSRELQIPKGYDWNTELFFNRKWPRKYYKSMSDFQEGTDVVLLWFENRLLHLLDLSYAYAVTKEESYAEAWMAQAVSWCRANPYCVGMNWRSPMEIGIRLYVLSLGLKELAGSVHVDSHRLRLIVESIVFQVDHLAANFSERGGQSNNHLIADAATLYAFATMWKVFSDSKRWIEMSDAVLAREIPRQVLPDGIDFENTFSYQTYVLDLCLFYMLFSGKNDRNLHPGIAESVRRLADSTVRLMSHTGRLPRFGDDSTREFLVLEDLGVIEGREVADPFVFSSLLKPEYSRVFETSPGGGEIAGVSVPLELDSVFPLAGYASLRGGDSHLVYSAGIQHDREINNGHVHADLGSFELELGKQMVFVNSGTYLYGLSPEVRHHFRQGRAHNTLLVDGKELMECGATFSWKRLQKGEMLKLLARDGKKIIGSRHRILHSPEVEFVHHRVIVKLGETTWLIVDNVARMPHGGDRPEATVHHAELFFHTPFEPSSCTLHNTLVRMPRAGGLEFEGKGSGRYEMRLVQDSSDMIAWYSPRYGDVKFGTTIVAKCAFQRSASLCHLLRADGTGGGRSAIECLAEKVEVTFDGDRGAWEFRFNPLRIAVNGDVIETADES